MQAELGVTDHHGKNVNNRWPCLPPLPCPLHIRVNPQHKDLSGFLEKLERGNTVTYQFSLAFTCQVSPKPSITSTCSISCSGIFLLPRSSASGRAASAPGADSNYAVQTAWLKALSHLLCWWQMRNLNHQRCRALGKCPSRYSRSTRKISAGLH